MGLETLEAWLRKCLFSILQIKYGQENGSGEMHVDCNQSIKHITMSKMKRKACTIQKTSSKLVNMERKKVEDDKNEWAKLCNYGVAMAFKKITGSGELWSNFGILCSGQQNTWKILTVFSRWN